MVRTQISLTEAQHRYLSELSHQSGESISAIIRHAVDRLRGKGDTPRSRAMGLLGAFEADRFDASINHDQALWAAEPEEPGKKKAKVKGRKKS